MLRKIGFTDLTDAESDKLKDDYSIYTDPDYADLFFEKVYLKGRTYEQYKADALKEPIEPMEELKKKYPDSFADF